MVNATTIAIVAALALAGIVTMDTARNIVDPEPRFVLEDIQITPDGYSNIRYSNVQALPVKWYSALVRSNSNMVICAGFGEATIARVPGNRYGPVPLNQFIGADCSEAVGEHAVIRTVVRWHIGGVEWRAVEHISDEFVVR